MFQKTKRPARGGCVSTVFLGVGVAAIELIVIHKVGMSLVPHVSEVEVILGVAVLVILQLFYGVIVRVRAGGEDGNFQPRRRQGIILILSGVLVFSYFFGIIFMALVGWSGFF